MAKTNKNSKKTKAEKQTIPALDNTGLTSTTATTKTEKRKKKDKTNKILIGLSVVSVAMVMVVLGQFFLIRAKLNDGKVVEGTVINGVNIEGLSTHQAESKLQQVFNKKAEDFELTLTHGDRKWTITRDDFEVNSDIHTVIELAQERERETDTYAKQKDLMSTLTKEGKSVNVAINYVFVGIDNKIDEIVAQVEQAPVDSEIIFNPDSDPMWTITDGAVGKRVDKMALYTQMNDQFIKSNKLNIELPMVDEQPTITKEYNQSLTKLVSSFSTNVADSTGGRKSNVNLALSKFNGMVVNPGEQVSFNKVTGPHTLENGYKVATVIYNSQFVDGVGGGICQASTTLYNALLTAGQQVDEVRKHTLPVKYVPLGLDAMVSEYISDLKWTNTTDYPIYIKTGHDSKQVFVNIYSHELPENTTYKTRAEVVRKIPHTGDVVKKDTSKEYTSKVLFEGEYYRLSYPRDGYEAKAYLQKYVDGKLVDETLIRHETYKPQNGVVIEGVEKAVAGMKVIDGDVDFITPTSAEASEMNNDVYTIPTNLCP